MCFEFHWSIAITIDFARAESPRIPICMWPAATARSRHSLVGSVLAY